MNTQKIKQMFMEMMMGEDKKESECDCKDKSKCCDGCSCKKETEDKED